MIAKNNKEDLINLLANKIKIDPSKIDLQTNMRGKSLIIINLQAN